MRLEITLDDFKALTEAGLQLNDLFVLQLIEDQVKWEDHALAWVIRMSLSRLSVKGYLEEGKVTAIGRQLLDNLNMNVITAKPVDLIGEFSRKLHEELASKLVQLTGKRQKMIQGKYSFLCNAMDLEKKLRDVIKRYGPLPVEKMRVCLLRHVEKSHKAGWDRVYLIEYFIMKDNVSRMVTDLENDEPDTSDEMRQLIDPKTMF